MTARRLDARMRDIEDDPSYSQRTPAYTRERLTDLLLKYHAKVPNPPKYNKGSRRFECGSKTCGPGWKSVQELERHYKETHGDEA